jgi:hypothetical protein
LRQGALEIAAEWLPRVPDASARSVLAGYLATLVASQVTLEARREQALAAVAGLYP